MGKLSFAIMVFCAGFVAACAETVERDFSTGGSGPGSTTASTSSAGGGMGGAGGTGGNGGSQGPGGGGGAGGNGCMPKTNDASSIGVDCEQSMSCPAGYVCQPYVGIIMTYSCQILCSNDCECPMGLPCITVSDKTAMWMQCGP